MNISTISRYIGISILLIAVTACSDNTTDSGGSTEPPTVPTPEQFQPDTEYFNGSNSEGTSLKAGEGFNAAALLVRGTVRGLFASSQLYTSFLDKAQQTDANYENGVWTWTYSVTKFQQSAEVMLTAEPNEDEDVVNWNLMLSTEGTAGPDLDNYRFMSGTTSIDGDEGRWNIFPYQTGDSSNENPMIVYNWVNREGENFQANYTISLPDNPNSFEVNYSREENEHTLSLTSSNGDTDVVIYWNTNTGNGYLDRADSDRICWNANHETVACQ